MSPVVSVDILGNPLRQRTRGFSGAWIHADIQYDEAGRVVFKSSPYFPGDLAFWEQNAYDLLGRPVENFMETEQGEVKTTSLVYNIVTQPIANAPDQNEYLTVTTTTESWSQSSSSLTRSSRVDTNVYGETYRQILPDNSETVFTYDVMGRISTTDGPLTNVDDVIRVEYDYFGHKTSVRDPDMGHWFYRHDSRGELQCQIDAEGHATFFDYDILGRVVDRAEFSGLAALPASCAQRPASNPEVQVAWEFNNVSGQRGFGQSRQNHLVFTDQRNLHQGRCTSFEEILNYEYDLNGNNRGHPCT